MSGSRIGLTLLALAVCTLLGGSPSAQEPPPGLSKTCRFTYGPKAGTVETFPLARPIPIDNPCTDGISSSGVAVAPPRRPGPGPSPAAGELRSPVNGGWIALQAPPCPNNMNHHCGTANQQFAYDLVLLDQYGRPASCIGQPVFSPSAGIIEHVMDGYPNHAVPNQHLAGNHVVIRRGPAEYILLAHFSPGTIRVKPGDQVAVGQLLGECGNSGNSSGPHVHMHMQDRPDPLQFHAAGRPMRFTSIGILGPGGCNTRTDHLVMKGQTICSR